MKKLLAVLAALTMVMSLSACGGKKTENAKGTLSDKNSASESITEEIEDTEIKTTEPKTEKTEPAPEVYADITNQSLKEAVKNGKITSHVDYLSADKYKEFKRIFDNSNFTKIAPEDEIRLLKGIVGYEFSLETLELGEGEEPDEYVQFNDYTVFKCDDETFIVFDKSAEKCYIFGDEENTDYYYYIDIDFDDFKNSIEGDELEIERMFYARKSDSKTFLGVVGIEDADELIAFYNDNGDIALGTVNESFMFDKDFKELSNADFITVYTDFTGSLMEKYNFDFENM